jgi:EAL domain-containing protein (putative c-di-GMP-specific phosphodiesterase class I)
VRISASIGVVLYEGGSTSADELVRRADQAMYRAKELGRNRIEFFHGRIARLNADSENTLTRIERALAAGELALYYQPRVDIQLGAVVGVEALIRWLHPVRGVVLPGEFLPVVEGTDFVRPLGDWVTDAALTQLEVWRADGLELAVSVNISPDHLKAPGFAARLMEHLDHHPSLPPACLELEVLESTALDDLGQIGSVIADCRAIGVRIALDDFGTGFSSLAYLKGMPADILKIDQSFVRDLLVDRDDFALVAAVIGLGKSFQKQVVAEGVESPDHGELLLRMGCHLAQGFGIARPMPASQLVPWIERFATDTRWQMTPAAELDRRHSPMLTADLRKG